MTEAKKAAMLLYLNDECKENGYEIFSDDDFLSLYPAALGVNKEEIARAVKTLDEEGYIDVRYAEGGNYCLSVLDKGRRYEAEEQPLSVRRSAMQTQPPSRLARRALESRCRHSSSASLRSAITQQAVHPP